MSERQPENKKSFMPLSIVEKEPTPSAAEYFASLDRALLNLSVSKNKKMSVPPEPLTSDELLRPITDKYAKQAETRHKKVLGAAAGFAMLTAGLGIGNHIATEINEPDIETAYVYQEPVYVENFDDVPPAPDPYAYDQLDGNKPSYPEIIDPPLIDPDVQPGDPYDNPPPYPVEEPDTGPVEHEPGDPYDNPPPYPVEEPDAAPVEK